MVTGSTTGNTALLRLLNSRLSTTPAWQLPHIVPYLANCIDASGIGLSSVVENDGRADPEISTLVHKIKTRISTLLQDKSPQARWAAVILVKAFIEAGGVDALREAGGWTRSIVGILSRSDPASTKKLCMVTLTRCFLLSQGHQSIVRELTTPLLSAFLTTAIKVLHGSSGTENPLLLVTMQALGELLPHHPASFRPFQAQIRSCILPILAPTPSSLQEGFMERSGTNCFITETVADSARRMFVLLSVCTPKRAEADDWTRSARLVCDAIHATADSVFRALAEDRDSTRPRHLLQSTSETVSSHNDELMELPSWIGVQAGVERLLGLLRLLQAFVVTPSDHESAIPVGIILDIFSRLMSVLPPSHGTRVNREIGRDERDGLVNELPHVHAHAIELISSVVQRLGQGAASFHQQALEQCLWVLGLESFYVEVRVAAYNFVHHVVTLFGVSFSDSFRPSLSHCLSLCCEDLLPSVLKAEHHKPGATEVTRKTATNGTILANTDAHMKSTPKCPQSQQAATPIEQAAAELIINALANLPNDFISQSVRAQIDRTAILIGNEPILLASVLYQPTYNQENQTSTSLVSFLARAFPSSNSAEALMKPRMPVAQLKQSTYAFDILHDGALEMEESMYNHLYSGSGVGDIDLPEQPSTVEDSTQADKDSHGEITTRTSNDFLTPVYSQPPTTRVSMVEVPETQAPSIAIGDKRSQDNVLEDQNMQDQLKDKVHLRQQSARLEREVKRPRLVETAAQETGSSIGDTQEERYLSLEAPQPEIISISQDSTTRDIAALEEDSDSDDSPLPTIDPTWTTDDEENSDSEANDV